MAEPVLKNKITTMDYPIISIIIPVYNGFEQYSQTCFDSIYSQGLPTNEFEVICVDDASTDNSYPILKKYEKIYCNLKILRHDHNKRQGGARNTGLSIAIGEIFFF